MRYGIASAFAAAAFFFATPALAGIPYGYNEFTTFVSDLPSGAEAMAGEDSALCHLVRKYHFAYLPVFYLSEGYVLGANRCETQRYIPLSAAQLASLRAMGAIPASLPDSPSLTVGQKTPPLILGGLAALVVAMIWNAERRRRRRLALLGTLPDPAKRLLDLLAHAARVCQNPPAEAAPALARLVTEATGHPVTAATASTALSATLRKPRPVDISRMARAFPRDERGGAVAAMQILVAMQPSLSLPARRFVKNFAFYMKGVNGGALKGRTADKPVSPMALSVDIPPQPQPEGPTPPVPASPARATRKNDPASDLDALTNLLASAVHQFGPSDPHRIAIFAAILGNVRGKPISHPYAEMLISSALTHPDDERLRSFAENLSAAQRELALAGAVMLGSGPSGLPTAARGFLGRLAAALGLSQRRAEEIIAEAA